MVFVATLLMAVGLVAGFLGLLTDFSHQVAFWAFWGFVAAAVVFLAIDVARNKRRHFLE